MDELNGDEVYQPDELEWDESSYFEGPCTCPPDCENFEDEGSHSWGTCGGTLADGNDCNCEAGWVE